MTGKLQDFKLKMFDDRDAFEKWFLEDLEKHLAPNPVPKGPAFRHLIKIMVDDLWGQYQRAIAYIESASNRLESPPEVK